MKTGHQRWQFSLGAVSLCFVVVGLTMFGGMLGVASGLQQTIVELSPANRQFAMVEGLTWGIAPAGIVGVIIHWSGRKPMVTFLVSACVAVAVPTVILHIITAMIAAV